MAIWNWTAHVDGSGAVPLKSFREKPDLETAQAMLASGGFLWNAGIFLMRVSDLIAAYQTHAPDMIGPCRAAIDTGAEDLGFLRLGAEAYGRAEAISFDYAIMERVDRVAAVPLTSGWSDLGAWDTLWQAAGPDADGNATRGPATLLDCRDSYLRSESDGIRLVGLGLEGIVAVAMPDAVLVADKSRAQDVKAVVDTLRTAGVPRPTSIRGFTGPGAGTRRCVWAIGSR
jgi:mannose-1-phosphate guanylyltransferase/mannose-6-phosphate isomerase